MGAVSPPQMPTPSPPPPSLPPPCLPTDGPIGGGVIIDFEDAVLAHSNLAGAGPDGGEEVVRFSGVGQYSGVALDLVITADGRYVAHNIAQTKVNGKFGAPAHEPLRAACRIAAMPLHASMSAPAPARQGKST